MKKLISAILLAGTVAFGAEVTVGVDELEDKGTIHTRNKHGADMGVTEPKQSLRYTNLDFVTLNLDMWGIKTGDYICKFETIQVLRAVFKGQSSSSKLYFERGGKLEKDYESVQRDITRKSNKFINELGDLKDEFKNNRSYFYDVSIYTKYANDFKLEQKAKIKCNTEQGKKYLDDYKYADAVNDGEMNRFILEKIERVALHNTNLADGSPLEQCFSADSEYYTDLFYDFDDFVKAEFKNRVQKDEQAINHILDNTCAKVTKVEGAREKTKVTFDESKVKSLDQIDKNIFKVQ